MHFSRYMLRRRMLRCSNVVATERRTKQVNIRVTDEAYEILNAAAFLEGRRGAPELIAPIVDDLVTRLRDDDQVTAVAAARRKRRRVAAPAPEG